MCGPFAAVFRMRGKGPVSIHSPDDVMGTFLGFEAVAAAAAAHAVCRPYGRSALVAILAATIPETGKLPQTLYVNVAQRWCAETGHCPALVWVWPSQ